MPERYRGDSRSIAQIIEQEKQGRIKSEFPFEWLAQFPDQLYQAAKQKDRAKQKGRESFWLMRVSWGN